MSDNVQPATIEESLARAAEAIKAADALVIGAGAGMGVDSGLPDFRGDNGFWTAYPVFRGKRFSEVSNPIWFERDPQQAWGFFGHRLHLYRDTQPHAGFGLLREWCRAKSAGYFVFTSNVDGHFQASGFDPSNTVECHGTIHLLQCSRPCSNAVWSSADLVVDVELDSIRATSPLPVCPKCGAVSRPNIVMFSDYNCVTDAILASYQRFAKWLISVSDKRVVTIELGAGLSVPTVRQQCESIDGQLIRINPRDNSAPRGAIALPLGALDALRGIELYFQN